MYSGLVTKSRVGIFVYNKIEPFFFTFIQDEIVWHFSTFFGKIIHQRTNLECVYICIYFKA